MKRKSNLKCANKVLGHYKLPEQLCLGMDSLWKWRTIYPKDVPVLDDLMRNVSKSAISVN